MKTVNQMVTWLKTPSHIKCTLVDISEVSVSGTSTTINLSSMAYSSGGTTYNACVIGGLNFSESLSADGSISANFGGLDLVNTYGVNDVFLTYVWNRRPIKIYLGDPSWPKSDFVLIFDGLVQELTANNENQLTLLLFDKLQRLNDSLTEKTLSDSTDTYTEKTKNGVANTVLLPLLFGECFNIQPLYVDTGATAFAAAGTAGTAGTAGIYGKVYMVNDGPISGIIEVRDNGVPIPVTEDLTKGLITLLSNPVGTITCSVQGNATTSYTNTIAGIVTKIVKGYGNSTNQFTDSEIDFSSFTSTSSNNSPVGIYCSDRLNALQVCNELAKSVSANLVCPSITVEADGQTISASKLKLVDLKVPSGTTKYTLSDDNMVLGSLSITQLFPVKPNIKLGYCKNYTVQQTVAGGVNPDSKFDDDYLVKQINGLNATLYRDTGTVVQENTLLITEADATTEATKRSNLWGSQRQLITATYLPELMFVQLGDIVKITSNRFNLNTNGGKTGLVYNISRDWITGLVQIGVLV
jgi:hypothetical protein